MPKINTGTKVQNWYKKSTGTDFCRRDNTEGNRIVWVYSGMFTFIPVCLGLDQP